MGLKKFDRRTPSLWLKLRQREHNWRGMITSSQGFLREREKITLEGIFFLDCVCVLSGMMRTELKNGPATICSKRKSTDWEFLFFYTVWIVRVDELFYSDPWRTKETFPGKGEASQAQIKPVYKLPRLKGDTFQVVSNLFSITTPQ